MPAAQRGDGLAQIDPDLLAAASALFPEIGRGQARRCESRRSGGSDSEWRRQYRIRTAGDLDGAGPLFGPAGDRPIPL
jgi:hypothetical protein